MYGVVDTFRKIRRARLGEYIPVVKSGQGRFAVGNSGKKVIRKMAQKIINKNSEREIVTVNVFSNTAPTAGTVTTIRCSGTAQGDADGNRQGNQISIKQWSLKIRLASDPVQIDTTKVRIIAFIDNQQIGVVPTDTMMLQDRSGDSTDYMKHINRVSQDPRRFKILHDRIYSLTPETLQETAAGGFTSRPLQSSCDRNIRILKRWKGAGHKVRYIGSTNVQGSDGGGSIYVMFITNVTANGPVIDTANEVQFTDS